jgi:hypothetical protein
MRKNILAGFIGLLFGLFGLNGSDVRGQSGIDRDTQRNGMHSCPLGKFVVGIRVDKNLLLCSGEFGGYTGSQEIVQSGGVDKVDTQSHGMHACPEGMAMTGHHVSRNLLACAPVARPPIPRFVDVGTQRSDMHACREGNPVSGIQVRKNLLLCGTREEVPPAEELYQVTLWLPPSSGQYTARYPTAGYLDGNVIRIVNPPNSVWLRFLKRGHESAECGNRDAYEYLGPGDTMTGNQMVAIFGYRSPALPVQFVVCSGAHKQRSAWGRLYFPDLALNIIYTRRR